MSIDCIDGSTRTPLSRYIAPPTTLLRYARTLIQQRSSPYVPAIHLRCLPVHVDSTVDTLPSVWKASGAPTAEPSRGGLTSAPDPVTWLRAPLTAPSSPSASCSPAPLASLSMLGAILMASLKIEIASLQRSCSSFIAGVHSAVCLRVFQCPARCIRLEVPTGSRVGRPHLDSGRGSLTSSCLLRLGRGTWIRRWEPVGAHVVTPSACSRGTMACVMPLPNTSSTTTESSLISCPSASTAACAPE